MGKRFLRRYYLSFSNFHQLKIYFKKISRLLGFEIFSYKLQYFFILLSFLLISSAMYHEKSVLLSLLRKIFFYYWCIYMIPSILVSLLKLTHFLSVIISTTSLIFLWPVWPFSFSSSLLCWESLFPNNWDVSPTEYVLLQFEQGTE